MVRVIAGSAGGLKLKTPESERTKPTLDRVKEPMFSILDPYLKGRTVLDLFAGSGALGIEALSRGAEFCCFNDSDRGCIRIIAENLEHTRLSGRGELSSDSYRKCLKRLSGRSRKFGILLLDPPYGKNYYEEVILIALRYGLLTPDCVIMCEHGRDNILPVSIGGFEAVKTRTYGTVGLTMYQYPDARKGESHEEK